MAAGTVQGDEGGGEGLDEWVEMDPDDPMLQPAAPCEVGPTRHTWKLTVCEGRVALTSGCTDCDHTVMDPVGGEDVSMEAEIVGTLTSHLERYGWETPEYDHWWEFHPTAPAGSPPVGGSKDNPHPQRGSDTGGDET